jgi:hypothetical protein
MKTGKWILYLSAIAFLVALPLAWIVAGLAADLHQIHPIAGLAVWVGALAAVLVLCIPVLRFLRLPALPPREVWDEKSGTVDQDTWKQTARLLIRTSDDPEMAADLQRVCNDVPHRLPEEVPKALARRRKKAVEIRSSTMRQAVLLSLLSPHRQMDFVILLWLNLRQVYFIARSYGFKPSPRGIFQLYASVFGAALLIDALDEAAEQALAEGASKLIGDIPFLSGASSLTYEAIRSAAYVGLIGLLTNYLLQNELRKPNPSERKAMRQQTWKDALEEIASINSGSKIQPDVTMA